MIRKITSIKDAAYEWVHEFNSYPDSMIAMLMDADPYSWEEVTSPSEDKKFDYKLPIWGTLWSFGDKIDDEWLEKENHIQVMSDCGFRIYRHAEWGFFFGVDGGGYDFYEAHWIPLYKARGLHWHEHE